MIVFACALGHLLSVALSRGLFGSACSCGWRLAVVCLESGVLLAVCVGLFGGNFGPQLAWQPSAA